jgi:hypothetical protein
MDNLASCYQMSFHGRLLKCSNHQFEAARECAATSNVSINHLSSSVIGRFLGIIIGCDPSVCKSNRLHVDILQFSFMKMGYIL